MKFRCPYCKHIYEGEPKTTCPHCHRTMTVPGHLKKITFRERKRAKDKIAREDERKRRQLLLAEVGFRRRPATIFLVIAVLAVVGALLCGRVTNVTRSHTSGPGPEAIARKDLFVISIALELFRNDCGRYPTSEEGLEALVANPGIRGWAYNYLTLIKADPWGSPYGYDMTNDVARLFCQGADRTPGTDDDIQSQPLDPRDVRSWIYQSEQYAEKIRRLGVVAE